ncbi:hypothetical protein J5I95_03590 [Candidatus Poribacteria bacterium]|nr:hypothetical protein [Candidatus Poribacteria bacterium]
MKPKVNFLGICCVAVVLLIGLIGCSEDAIEEDPVSFVSAIPLRAAPSNQTRRLSRVLMAPLTG